MIIVNFHLHSVTQNECTVFKTILKNRKTRKNDNVNISDNFIKIPRTAKSNRSLELLK